MNRPGQARVPSSAVGTPNDIAFVALGSNLGDRAAHLQAGLGALDETGGVRVLQCSPFMETDPVGPAGQGKYLNAVARVQCSLEPGALMRRLLEVEAAQGRTRAAGERWGPRTLDLDLLLFGERITREPGLILPHPRLAERAFVLEPWCLIAPAVVIPGLGRTVEDLAAALRGRHPVVSTAGAPAREERP